MVRVLAVHNRISVISNNLLLLLLLLLQMACFWPLVDPTAIAVLAVASIAIYRSHCY